MYFQGRAEEVLYMKAQGCIYNPIFYTYMDSVFASNTHKKASLYMDIVPTCTCITGVQSLLYQCMNTSRPQRDGGRGCTSPLLIVYTYKITRPQHVHVHAYNMYMCTVHCVLYVCCCHPPTAVMPPYIPSVTGPDDTSNFDEFETQRDCGEDHLTTPQPRRTLKGFSGKSLPFIGFTFTKMDSVNLMDDAEKYMSICTVHVYIVLYPCTCSTYCRGKYTQKNTCISMYTCTCIHV